MSTSHQDATLAKISTTTELLKNSIDEKQGCRHNGASDSDTQDFPDGGVHAWMTVLGGLLSTTAGIGVLSGFAVFQSYFSTAELTNYSPQDIAWIGNLQIWGCFAFGLLSGWMSDRYGPKLPMAIGTVFMVLGTMMASISKTYYQFILSQGVCSAIGIGFSFIPALAVQCQWFLKRRSFVVGLVVSGQNIGGVIWPVVVNNLINVDGISFGWSLRVIGFLQLLLMVSATLLMQRRFTLSTEQLQFPMVKFIKSGRTMLFTLAMFIAFLGIYIPYFYITSYAMQNGVDAKLAFYYSAILNAAAFFGCYAIGYLADSRVGPFNSVVLLAIASGAVAFGWMGAHSNAGMIVWTIVYGFLTGGFQTVFTPCIAHLAPAPELISTWDGMVLVFVSFATLGSGSIGGRLLDNTGGTNYVPMQAFTGATLVASGFLFLLTRFGAFH